MDLQSEVPGLREGRAVCRRELRHLCEGSYVVRRHDDQPGKAFFERDHPQQVFAVGLRIRIGFSAGDPRAFLALGNSFQLPYDVANKRIARPVVQCHEDDHAARSVTERGYDHD